MKLTSNQMREVEQAAVNGGISWIELMENAGTAAAEEIQSKFDIFGRSIVILCGKGNNGGDGFVIARKFYQAGANVIVILMAGEPSTEQAKEMLRRIANDNIQIIRLDAEPDLTATAILNASLIIDAVYGIGFHGALPDCLRRFFQRINKIHTPVVAIDIPSGLESDSGHYDSDSLQAQLTITFTATKPGLESPAACEIYGRVKIVSIGIDKAYLKPYSAESFSFITKEKVQDCFSPRPADANKGTFGRALLFCGSKGMMGAAMLSAGACLRCGAGLTELALPHSLYPIAASHLCEPIFTLLAETDTGDFSLHNTELLRSRLQLSSAVGIGCGLGFSRGSEELVLDCLTQATSPIVLDADGINILSKHLEVLKTISVPMIITPHPGEMSRLTGKTIAEIQANRIKTAQTFAEEWNVIVVLKGEETVIAIPGEPPLLNTTGNPGMATGGSGDVLTGMITSLLAQGMCPTEAAMCGVYLHGLAGDRVAAKLSQHAMLPSDLINELSSPFLEIEIQK
ncbi:NAD(P)H-hydrate dehydratase [Scatolibacter rhodanostii]|uniref:NAD(P)H-hydrate dehydratase n=1 Tax=Scatolibacter rhodanostii TaxID=2014781 RepID=UPI000C082630|nr:NAD(P)H-hydrate dehydratase [Scatolibacter rhodanostii]